MASNIGFCNAPLHLLHDPLLLKNPKSLPNRCPSHIISFFFSDSDDTIFGFNQHFVGVKESITDILVSQVYRLSSWQECLLTPFLLHTLFVLWIDFG